MSSSRLVLLAVALVVSLGVEVMAGPLDVAPIRESLLNPMRLLQTVSTDPTTGAEKELPKSKDARLGECLVCKYVLNRLAMGQERWMSDVCAQMYDMYHNEYANCQMVLEELRASGDALRPLFEKGCAVNYPSGVQVWRKPCPADGMCTTLRNSKRKHKPFCRPHGDSFDSDFQKIFRV